MIVGRGSLSRVVKALEGPPGVVMLTERSQSDPVLHSALIELDSRGWTLLPVASREPSIEMVEQCVAFLRSKRSVNSLMAIGGGSVQDLAKAVAIASIGMDWADSVASKRVVRLDLSGRCNLVAVPTTLGSGSESSTSAVILNREHVKVPLVGRALLPNVAILDPILVKSAPIATLARSVLDLLGHAVESALSKLPNEGAHFLATSALASVASWSRSDERDWGLSAITSLQLAGNFAGQAQDRMLVGPAHALAHAQPSIPHGLAVGYFLRALSNTYLRHYPETGNRLRALLVEAGWSLDGFFDTLTELLELAGGDFLAKSQPLIPHDSEHVAHDPSAAASPIPIDNAFLDRIQIDLSEKS